MRILLIDNYDSFAYNLVQALRVLGAEVEVFRNDVISVDGALARPHDRVVISPGPCTPAEAGISVELCRRSRAPLLGVCLGHQSLVAAFGGRVDRAERVRHGKTSPVRHDGDGLLARLPDPFVAARYHSLVAREIPSCLRVCAAAADDGECMAVRHESRPLFGVQFHPESFLTPDGPRILRNFLELVA
ncbi:MAG: anthranilate synthase component II [Planctomycetota bacterium]